MDVEHFEAPLIYPPGCEALTQNLATEELCGRLETLAYTFHTMGQDEGAYQELIPLALHLATDYFLMHPSEKVRLLIACCIADMLRVYAPEAPYKNPDQVKDIFMFLINQLAGLKDPKDPQFMRCVNLLEKLSREKLFNMLMGLDHCQGIFCNLVKMMFRIVNEKHSAKVKTYMLELMCPLITEYDKLSNEMLDTIAINIVEPNKSQLKSAYLLSKAIVVRCYEVFSKFVKKVLDKSQDTKDLAISVKVYELVYEMNQNCPTFLLDTIPQLELNLKSPDDEKRLGAVSFLAPMFSAPDSVWAISCRPLWQAFLSCCRDPSTVVCTKCVQGSPQILLNHPDLQQDVCRALFLCQRDTEEHVRFEVVMAIMATAEKEIQVVSTSPGLIQLLNILSSDKLGKVRRKAMSGLAMIYKNHLMMDANVPEATEKAVLWIRDKILHSYCLPDLDDKLMVEKLLKTCLVPSSLPTEDRMKKLYYLVGNVNEKAEIAFNALLKQQVSIRNLMSEILEIQKRPQEEAKDKEMDVKIEKLSQHLPEPIKAKKFLKEFLAHMAKDPSLLQVMVKLMNPEVNCKERSDCMSQALEKLELPVRNNVYYNTVKMLLERTSSVMVDHEAVKVLVGYVDACLRHSPLIKELGLQHCAAGWRGLILLKTLADVFTSHFLHEDVIRPLIKMLDLDDIHLQEYVPRLVLSILAVIGKCKPIGLMYPDIMVELTPKCQQWCVTGTPKALRQAIHCLFHNIPDGTETNTGARKSVGDESSCDEEDAQDTTDKDVEDMSTGSSEEIVGEEEESLTSEEEEFDDEDIVPPCKRAARRIITSESEYEEPHHAEPASDGPERDDDPVPPLEAEVLNLDDLPDEPVVPLRRRVGYILSHRQRAMEHAHRHKAVRQKVAAGVPLSKTDRKVVAKENKIVDLEDRLKDQDQHADAYSMGTDSPLEHISYAKWRSKNIKHKKRLLNILKTHYPPPPQ